VWLALQAPGSTDAVLTSLAGLQHCALHHLAGLCLPRHVGFVCVCKQAWSRRTCCMLSLLWPLKITSTAPLLPMTATSADGHARLTSPRRCCRQRKQQKTSGTCTFNNHAKLKTLPSREPQCEMCKTAAVAQQHRCWHSILVTACWPRCTRCSSASLHFQPASR